MVLFAKSDSAFTCDNVAISFPLETQILKGVLEGASRILPALRILRSLLSSCSDPVALYSFCHEAGLPGLLLSLLRHSQESNSIQQVSTMPAASKDVRGFLFRVLFFRLPSLFGSTALYFLSSSLLSRLYITKSTMPSEARQ